jgi:hypothetical protein
VREIGRFAYLWAWPMVNVYNRFTSLRRIWRPILISCIAPVAPINHLAMLHDYIGPRQRYRMAEFREIEFLLRGLRA